MQHHLLTPSEWSALAADPDYRALLRARHRFTRPATAFALIYFLSLPLGIAFEPELMARAVAGPVTFALLFALSQFLMAWLLLALYVHAATRFDEASARLVERTQRAYQS